MCLFLRGRMTNQLMHILYFHTGRIHSSCGEANYGHQEKMDAVAMCIPWSHSLVTGQYDSRHLSSTQVAQSRDHQSWQTEQSSF